jgi:type IV pilus assembly protein PilV
MRRRSRGSQSGFSLIELMIAAAIFSTGLGAFSLLLLLSIQGTVESGQQTVAVQHARYLAESVRLIPGAVPAFENPTPQSDCPVGSSCTPGQMASSSFLRWQRRLARELPGGTGLICRDGTPEDGTASSPACDGGGQLVVKVFWTEPGQDGHSLERRTVSRLPLL